MHNGYIPLPSRGIIKISGPDSKNFLQGIITNDVNLLSPDRVLYSAILTPQGRYLFDFFLYEDKDAVYLETEQPRTSSLIERLSAYKLHSNIIIEEASAKYAILSLLGSSIFNLFNLPPVCGQVVSFFEGIIAVDPRLSEIGLRTLIPREKQESFSTAYNLANIPCDIYENARLSLGLPDGSRDMVIEKSIPLECGLDELKAIAWDKGCYLGQELNARTRYRGTIRKRLLPVAIKGGYPSCDSPIFWKDEEVGIMRTSQDERGLAYLRLEAVEEALATGRPMQCGQASLSPYIPSWMQLSRSQE